MKNTKTLLAAVLMAVVAVASSFAQDPVCGPEYLARDTVWISTLGSDSASVDTINLPSVDLAENQVWTPENLYILDCKAYVMDGQDLTIMPGTVIKAIYGQGVEAPALVVTRGGKIYANGSNDCPIILTTVNDPLDGTYSITNKEQWGGVILLGRATNSVLEGDLNPENPDVVLGTGADGIGFIEGLPWPNDRHHYGADITGKGGVVEDFQDDDNSGVLRYVSIRHGGAEIGTANEINGLTCGSVGNGTTLEHIEIISNGDDGVEFFGGTVDIRWLSVIACEDDYVDWDQGYSGRGQFIFGAMLGNTDVGGTNYTAGDNGMECDGDDGPGHSPLSDPVFTNITILGHGGGSDKGLELKERTLGDISNAIIANFGIGANFRDASLAGALDVSSVTFVNCDTLTFETGDADPEDTTGFAAAQNIFVPSLNGLDYEWSISVNTTGAYDVHTVTDAYDAVPAPGTVGDTYSLSDTWFHTADYRGAFQPGSTPWTEGWTIADDMGSSSNTTVCPTDLNGDAKTDGADLLILIANIGTGC
jgi:hypothetical protein